MSKPDVRKSSLNRSSDQRPDACAVVIGVDSLPGIQTARILASRGVTVVGVASDPKHGFCRSNACERVVQADTSSAQLVHVLKALVEEFDRKPVLFPCEDQSVLVLSRHRDALQDGYHIMLPPADVVELLIDKVAFYDFANEHDLPVPPTFILRSRQDAELAAARLPYPAVLKPPHRTEAWVGYTPAKALKVSGPEELLAQYDGAHLHVETLIAQKWIAGTDKDLYSCNCYFADGEPLVTFTAKKIRQWPPRTGISSLGEECRNEHVVALTHQLFQSVPYHGLAYLEVKLDAVDGQHYIVEPNIGRPTGRSAIAEAGGVELIYTMYCNALGLPLPENRQQQFNGVKWIYLRHDLQSAFYYWRQRELTFGQWLETMKGPKAFAVFSWRDPIPFLLDCLHPLGRLLTAKGRKSRDYQMPVAPDASVTGR